MTRSQSHRLLFAVLALTVVCCSAPSNIVAQTPKATTVAAPLIFEQNNGQAPAQYHFLARRDGVESLYAADGVDIFVPQSHSSASRLQIRWKGADRGAAVSGEAPLPGHSNYLHGSDPTRWLRNILQFSRVRYQQIYPGIDLLFHGNGDELENDFLVAPGADPTESRGAGAGGAAARATLDRPGELRRLGRRTTDLRNHSARNLHREFRRNRHRRFALDSADFDSAVKAAPELCPFLPRLPGVARP